MATTISDLIRTMSTYFRIGTIRWKDSSGEIQARNGGDTAHADVGVNQLRIRGSNASNAIVLAAPAGLGGNVTLTMPNDDGTPGQFLQTDGSGTLDWVDATSNGDLTDTTDFNQASGTLAMFTPPANSIIREVRVIVEVAAGGGSPTIEVGVAGTTNRYVATTQVDLLVAGTYIVTPEYEEDGTPEAIIATVVASAQTFSGRIEVTYTNPS